MGYLDPSPREDNNIPETGGETLALRLIVVVGIIVGLLTLAVCIGGIVTGHWGLILPLAAFLLMCSLLAGPLRGLFR